MPKKGEGMSGTIFQSRPAFSVVGPHAKNGS
jgi:hypothetical protein